MYPTLRAISKSKRWVMLQRDPFCSPDCRALSQPSRAVTVLRLGVGWGSGICPWGCPVAVWVSLHLLLCFLWGAQDLPWLFHLFSLSSFSSTWQCLTWTRSGNQKGYNCLWGLSYLQELPGVPFIPSPMTSSLLSFPPDAATRPSRAAVLWGRLAQLDVIKEATREYSLRMLYLTSLRSHLV